MADILRMIALNPLPSETLGDFPSRRWDQLRRDSRRLPEIAAGGGGDPPRLDRARPPAIAATATNRAEQAAVRPADRRATPSGVGPASGPKNLP